MTGSGARIEWRRNPMSPVAAAPGHATSVMSIGTPTGPIGASAVFDHHRDDTPFLRLTIGLTVAGSTALARLPNPADVDGRSAPPFDPSFPVRLE